MRCGATRGSERSEPTVQLSYGKNILIKRAAVASGAIVLVGAGVTPALAVEYPPPVDPTEAPATATDNTTNSASVDGATPAYTGSNATTLGLLAGLAAVGIGGGLVVASRRKNS